ncbi:MAG: hypothetical protein EOO06_03460 [Chitinophagaceae bacterium]|nr:MAG: hypothetical protein EOO06_03460 [Chitinophagaceae bacterium]
MKYLLLLLATSLYFDSFGQFDFTADARSRTAFYDPGLNAVGDHLKHAGIRKEASFIMIYNNNGQLVDSLLMSYSEYDNFGQLLTSLRYDEEIEILYKSSNTYKAGKPVKRQSTKIINGETVGSEVIEFDEAGREKLLYVFDLGEPDPTVYQKQYNKKGQLQYLWEADPLSKRFSMLASYEYLSDGSLKKITKYPSYRKRFKTAGKIWYFKTSKENDLLLETVSDEYGQELITYFYSKDGRCIGNSQERIPKQSLPGLQPFQNKSMSTTTIVSGTTTYATPLNSYNSANSSRISALTDGRNTANENWRPASAPYTAPTSYSRHYPAITLRTSLWFNQDATVHSIVTKNNDEKVTQEIRYYYNEQAILP